VDYENPSRIREVGLSKVAAAMPPARDIEGDMLRARKIRVPDMHAFSQTSANAEPKEAPSGENPPNGHLPPPEQWVLCKMTEEEVAELIEEHIDYYVEGKWGRRSVHLAAPFVKHFMKRDDGALPTVVAIATAPLVLADGVLLAPEGLDRERGIQFIVPDELRAAIPKREDCTPERVKQAWVFLCDEWLVDVSADYVGKATVIADALTIIERSLLPDRPCFFVTAGRRGGGKTTVLKMMIMAVTGLEAAAAAWSSNEEERRKTVMSYFLYGVGYIIWDNIPRGTQISCPHIERSCTSRYYSDRKLGVSQIICTAASVVHNFTGNNIKPKGEVASRSLEIWLDVNRVDPENRPFQHPDPLGWTESHRAKILVALYTILLGNPQLEKPQQSEAKTRFKMWWRLIGSAIEYAAGLADKKIEFQKLFLKQEDDDEESTSLAEVLETLKKWFSDAPDKPGQFYAKDLDGRLKSPLDEEHAEEGHAILSFLAPNLPPGQWLSAKALGRRLAAHVENPVRSGEHTLVLKKGKDRKETLVFSVQTTGAPPPGSAGLHEATSAAAEAAGAPAFQAPANRHLEFDADSGAVVDKGPYQDHLKNWFEACVEVGEDGPGAFVTDLYASYTAFEGARGETPYSEKIFVERLKARANEFKIKEVGKALQLGRELRRGAKGIKGIKEVKTPNEG
jgi:hypothetical protein